MSTQSSDAQAAKSKTSLKSEFLKSESQSPAKPHRISTKIGGKARVLAKRLSERLASLPKRGHDFPRITFVPAGRAAGKDGHFLRRQCIGQPPPGCSKSEWMKKIDSAEFRLSKQLRNLEEFKKLRDQGWIYDRALYLWKKDRERKLQVGSQNEYADDMEMIDAGSMDGEIKDVEMKDAEEEEEEEEEERDDDDDDGDEEEGDEERTEARVSTKDLVPDAARKKTGGRPSRNIDRYRGEIAILKQEHLYPNVMIRKHLSEKYGNDFGTSVISRALRRWGVIEIVKRQKPKNGRIKEVLDPYRSHLLKFNDDGMSIADMLQKFSETFGGIRTSEKWVVKALAAWQDDWRPIRRALPLDQLPVPHVDLRTSDELQHLKNKIRNAYLRDMKDKEDCEPDLELWADSLVKALCFETSVQELIVKEKLQPGFIGLQHGNLIHSG